MAKTDLRARPIFHHQRDSIEAHLTIMFAALAVSRHLQDASGLSIAKIVRALRLIRSAILRINHHEITIDPEIRPASRSRTNGTSQVRPESVISGRADLALVLLISPGGFCRVRAAWMPECRLG